MHTYEKATPQTMQSSVYQWLEMSITSQKNCVNPLQNPFCKNYWSDFSLCHSNLIKSVKRFWHFMDTFVITQSHDEEDEEKEIDVSHSSEWNSILCVGYSYEDYERKLVNGEISFSKNEHPKKDFSMKSFQRKLLEILNLTEQKVFNLSLPEDVIQRIDDVCHRRPFKNSPISKFSLQNERVNSTTVKLIKRKKGTKSLTFIVVGSLDVASNLKSQFLQRQNEKMVIKQELDVEEDDINEWCQKVFEEAQLSNKRIFDCEDIENYLENSSYHKKRKLIIDSGK